jgi:lipoyl-dependent peroxiredoxin
MPFEEVTEVSYTTAATAKGGRGGSVRSADGVVDLPLGPPGSRTNPKANP